MFGQLLCIFLASLQYEAGATASHDLYYQQGPLTLRTQHAIADNPLNHSLYPDYCFELEEDEESEDDDDATKSRRRRSSLSSEVEKTEYHFETNNLTEVFGGNFTTSNHSGYSDYSHLSEEFLKCKLWPIEENCYYILPNGSAYIPVYNRSFRFSEYLEVNEELLVCPNLLIVDVDKFSHTFSIVSNIGLGISIICMVLHMLTFILVAALRNLPGYCLISLCVSLVIAYLSFLMVQTLEKEDNCYHIGMLMYYFFLASFFWMNILAYDVWRSLRMAISKLRLNTNIWLRFAVYSLYSWGSAGLIVLCAEIITTLGDVSEQYRLHFHKTTCWFEYKGAMLFYFAAPFFVLLSVNCMYFIFSFVLITSASMKTTENKSVLWSRFWLFARLATIMSLGWIFGVIATATNEDALWYFFVILNTSQGVLIFFSFSCGKKTQRAWKSRVQKRHDSSTPTQYSYQSHNMTISSV